jgi:predicted dehydrogenase
VQPAVTLARRYGVTAYPLFEEMLDACDAVAFAVPPAVQQELAGLAAERGKAALLEIPMAADLAGAEELTRTIGAAGVVSQLALTWRYTSAVREFLGVSVPRTRPLGGSARLVSAAFAPGSSARPWQIEMGVLLQFGPHLVDILDAALGRIGDVSGHGDPHGWVGLLLEHSEGRFSEASLTASANVKTARADLEIFGSGGEAAVECEAAAGPDAHQTMYGEFVAAVGGGAAPELDVRRGLHLQHIVGEAAADLIHRA